MYGTFEVARRALIINAVITMNNNSVEVITTHSASSESMNQFPVGSAITERYHTLHSAFIVQAYLCQQPSIHHFLLPLR